MMAFSAAPKMLVQLGQEVLTNDRAYRVYVRYVCIEALFLGWLIILKIGPRKRTK